MSMVARRAARAVPRARPYSVLGNPKASEFMAKRAAVEEHAGRAFRCLMFSLWIPSEWRVP